MPWYDDDEEYYQYLDDKKAEEQREYDEYRDHQDALAQAEKEGERDGNFDSYNYHYGNGDREVKEKYRNAYDRERSWQKQHEDKASDENDYDYGDLNERSYQSSSASSAASAARKPGHALATPILLIMVLFNIPVVGPFLGFVVFATILSVIGIDNIVAVIGWGFHHPCLFVLAFLGVSGVIGFMVEKAGDAIF